MPVAHCVYTIDEIRAHRTVAKTLMAGAALASLASAKQLLALCSLRKTISNADQGKMTIGTINVTFTLKEVA